MWQSALESPASVAPTFGLMSDAATRGTIASGGLRM